jgi:hypothetical protein
VHVKKPALPFLLLSLDLLLQEDGVPQGFDGSGERRCSRVHASHGVQAMFGLAVTALEIRPHRAYLGAALDGGRQRLPHVLRQPVEGQGRLVGADMLKKGLQTLLKTKMIWIDLNGM